MNFYSVSKRVPRRQEYGLIGAIYLHSARVWLPWIEMIMDKPFKNIYSSPTKSNPTYLATAFLATYVPMYYCPY